MKLRPYQQECVQSVGRELLGDTRSTLVVMPTGCGKTVVFGHVAKDWHNGRILVLAHREELIYQACDKIERISGEIPDIEMSNLRASRTGMFGGSRIVVSSIQTQNAGRRCYRCDGKCVIENSDGTTEPCRECLGGIERRMQRFDPREFGLIIVDEAHHAPAETYKRAIEYYRDGNPALKVLGVTATPDRHDEAALGQVFDTVAYEFGVLDAIDEGWLVPIQQEFIQCESLDFSKCRTTAGDLNGADLAKVMEEERALHEVTQPTIDIAGDRATLIFATSVAQAELMAEIINRSKPQSAICIHGGTASEDRRDELKKFAAGKYQFLVGCGVFLEGFDEPRIEVVAMARPTKSRALYAQAIGRGTRPIVPPMQETAEERKAAIAASSKPCVHVLDFVGNAGRHKLITTADILGGNYDDAIVERAVAAAREKGCPVDMRAELIEAERAAVEEKRRERAKVTSKAAFRREVINPFDIFDMAPQREAGYHRGKPASDKQLAMLERNGINVQGMSRQSASKLVGEIIRRREQGLCSYKQAKILSRYGYATDVPFSQASQWIDGIAKSGWKRPAEVAVATSGEVPF